MQDVADRGRRPVASGQIAGVEDFLGTVRTPDPGAHAFSVLLEAGQLRAPLDADAQLLELFDQQTLVRVLGKGDRKGKRRAPLADEAERDAGRPRAFNPEIDGRDRYPAFHDQVGDSELPVELERAGLNRQRARRRTCFGRPVDDAHGNAAARQPEREGESRRAGADDQDRCLLPSIAHMARAMPAIPTTATSSAPGRANRSQRP